MAQNPHSSPLCVRDRLLARSAHPFAAPHIAVPQWALTSYSHGAGAKFLTNEEAQSVGELNMRHSHATHDLYNRIRDGNAPEWTWYVQTMPVSADPAEVGFDPLDDTKVRSPTPLISRCLH